jgi:hypothetical protein
MRSYLSIIFILITLTGCQSVSGSLSQSRTIEITATGLAFDGKTGLISYTLPEDALVRIRVGLRDGGPLLRTLVDLEEQKKGTHTIVWDQYDQSGKILLGINPDTAVIVACYKPVDNALQKTPEMTLSFPQAVIHPDSGIPIVKDNFPIRVEIADKDKARLTKAKFEVSIYVDGVFVVEDEEGTSPFTYQLNTQGINNGRHMITVNIISYSGEIGTASAMVEVNTHGEGT